MEDEFCTALDFCAVFDGHGGEEVSRYVRENLYAEVQAALPAVLAGTSAAEKDINDIVLAVGTERGKLQKSYSVEDQIRNRNPDKEINDQALPTLLKPLLQRQRHPPHRVAGCCKPRQWRIMKLPYDEHWKRSTEKCSKFMTGAGKGVL
jgi:serine/threonine protein phosphatase PrpC